MKLLIVDDHAIFRAGLKVVLGALDADLTEATSGDEALAHLERDPSVDIVLLDLHMPGSDGWSALRGLRSNHPDVPVVIVSASEDAEDARRALDDGASGYISKSSDTRVFQSALQLVLDGSLYIPPVLLDRVTRTSEPNGDRAERGDRQRPALTARQREVLGLLARGLTNPEIGRVLDISEGTVKAHISAILAALEVSNRTEAVLVMREMGLEP